MTRVSRFTVERWIFAGTPVTPVCPRDRSETRVSIALLASALFLQRFSLPFGRTSLSLDIVPVAFILLHQFLSGKLLIQYDRLLWFIAFGLAATCSLLLNLKHASLTSFLLALVLCSLLTLNTSSNPNVCKSTFQAFQFLVMILSCLSVAQFVLQFVVDGYQLINLYGIVPDVFFNGGSHTIYPIEGSSLLKSNGIFLREPSDLTQILALGILIEVLEFRRPRYLLVMVLGSLFAYSGAGMVTLLVFLPLASLRHGKVALCVLVVGMLALGLFATGIVDVSVFLSRTAEFDSPEASGFFRFIGPFWMAAKFFDTASFQAVLIGSGPGTRAQLSDLWYSGASGWLKQLFEYGIIGSFIFICFLASCLRGSRYPRLVCAAVIFTVFFIQDFLTTWVCTIMIVFCTLHGPEPRHRRNDRQARRLPALAPTAG